MLLTITCDTAEAADLGYLLHKNPANVYEADLWFGRIRVFYPRVEARSCTVALLMEVDPVGLVRGGNRRTNGLDQYVNDRPYVASSLLSVALVEAFGNALNGRSRERPARVSEKMRVTVCLAALNGASDELVTRLFTPLGYAVEIEREALDLRFPEWGASPISTLTLRGEQTVQDVLTHLYVLMPVLDNAKHYYVGADEIAKLLQKGAAWLPAHPEKELITRRYLNYRHAMVRQAMNQINLLEVAQEESTETQDETDTRQEAQEQAAEAPLHLNDARMQAAVEAVRSLQPPAKRVLDLGCGEGRLLRRLQSERYLTDIVGVDVSVHTLERAASRLRLDTLPEREKARLRLMHGSLVYRDDRFLGFDAALLIEVIEHLDPPRLIALEQVVFRHARPRRIIVTTPNQEYNRTWPTLPAGHFRHRDHRFEWTRAEFQTWAQTVAEREGYHVAFAGIGPEDDVLGCPTQRALFDLKG